MADGKESGEKVVIERTFDAPTEFIWRMWTDPDRFKAWYGPSGATIPVANVDVRVGGARLVCMEMQTPNGTMQMWFTGECREVVENQRLVCTESMSDTDANVLSPSDMGMPDDHPTTTEIIVELEDLGDRTRMVLTHVGIPEGSPGAVGWTMALDQLTAYLASPSSRERT